MPKDSLKDKLEGNELDLSLSNLSVVPVKDLAALPRATNLDLSCNLITSLPEGFCSLSHLVKIDLSKNSLTELPANFGDLQNLQHLDLLGNQLTLLPISVWQLRKLKWLDLKDNPLDESLKGVVGDCQDEVQCRRCAQQVVSYMKSIHNHMMKIENQRLKEEQEQEEALKALEEKERQEKKARKKAEKDRKRKEYEAKKSRTRQDQYSPEEEDEQFEESPRLNGLHKEVAVPKERSRCSCAWMFLTILVLAAAILVGVYFFCEQDKQQELCQNYWQPYLNRTSVFLSNTRQQIIHFYQVKKKDLGF